MEPSLEVRAPSGPGRVKGAVFRELLRWIELRFGREVLAAAYARLSEAERSLLEPDEIGFGVDASAWYPGELALALVTPAIQGIAPDDYASAMSEAARFHMDRNFRGLYRPLFQILITPERVARHIQKVWDLHWDSGQVFWTLRGEGRIETALFGFRMHRPWICEMLRSAEEFMVELTGATNVTSRRIECVERGGRSCRSEIVFSP